MIRTLLFAGAAALCLAPAAQAEHERYGSYNAYGPQPTIASAACERQKDQDKLAGGIVGAVAGGLLGAAIGGELEPDNGYHRYRGHRGYRGYRGYHGHRGQRRGYYHDRGDDGAEIAGAVIGGLLGAAVGSELASGNTDCARTYNYGMAPSYRATPNSRYGDAYAPTRSPTGPAWETPQRAPAYPQGQPVAAPAPPPYDQPYEDDLYGGADEGDTQAGECTTVRRETRLPDGTVIREPVEVCQTEDGRWQMPSVIPGS